MNDLPPLDIRWTFHGTAVVRDYDRAADWLIRVCGAAIIDLGISDHPMVQRKGGVIWIGDNGLELMEPRGPDGAPGRFLARFGEGFYALAFQVEDAAATAKRFTADGLDWVGDPAEGFIFTKPQQADGLLFEWASLEEDWDPRFGAPLPGNGGTAGVRRILHWGALVTDPAAAVRRLRAFWPIELLAEEYDAPLTRPQALISLKDGTLALYRLPPDETSLTRIWGLSGLRPRFHEMRLGVDSLAQARAALAAEGAGVLREDGGILVTRPEATFGMVLSWV